MTDRELEKIAVEFLGHWRSYQESPLRGTIVPFEKQDAVKRFIDMGFIADHVNPRQGEYAIQHTYAGVAFFTGSGELVFTKKGLPLARKICDIYRKRTSDMHVIKIEYHPNC